MSRKDIEGKKEKPICILDFIHRTFFTPSPSSPLSDD